jgi:hypothetical protein
MQKQFREEVRVQVNQWDKNYELWEIGLDVWTDGDHARPFVSYGGLSEPDMPLPVLKVAVAKWAEWLATI